MTADELFSNHCFDRAVEAALDEAPVLRDLRAGRLPGGDFKALILRHTAEVRTALDVKLPARMRLCPTDAFSAKRFFWRLYAEEQGEFVSERNHAYLIAALARQIGITDDEMTREYRAYSALYRPLLTEEPSHEALVRELTISCVWEGVILRLGTEYIPMIKQALSLSDESVEYFDVHREDDVHHSAAALDVLQSYVRDEDVELVLATIRRTLIEENPWALQLAT